MSHDKKLDNPQTFRRDPSKPPKPLEEMSIHVEKMVFSKRKKQHVKKWKRLRLGKKRLAYIREHMNQMSSVDIAHFLKIPVQEIHYIVDRIRVLDDPPPIEKNAYLQYMEDTYASYDTTPLGASGPVHYEQFVQPSENDSRMLEIRSRPINY